MLLLCQEYETAAVQFSAFLTNCSRARAISLSCQSMGQTRLHLKAHSSDRTNTGLTVILFSYLNFLSIVHSPRKKFLLKIMALKLQQQFCSLKCPQMHKSMHFLQLKN